MPPGKKYGGRKKGTPNKKTGNKQGAVPAFAYLSFIEFGTPHIPAQAPMRKAARAMRDDAETAFTQTLRTEIWRMIR